MDQGLGSNRALRKLQRVKAMRLLCSDVSFRSRKDEPGKFICLAWRRVADVAPKTAERAMKAVDKCMALESTSGSRVYLNTQRRQSGTVEQQEGMEIRRGGLLTTESEHRGKRDASSSEAVQSESATI